MVTFHLDRLRGDDDLVHVVGQDHLGVALAQSSASQSTASSRPRSMGSMTTDALIS
jgi:hypothetical protein